MISQKNKRPAGETRRGCIWSVGLALVACSNGLAMAQSGGTSTLFLPINPSNLTWATDKVDLTVKVSLLNTGAPFDIYAGLTKTK